MRRSKSPLVETQRGFFCWPEAGSKILFSCLEAQSENALLKKNTTLWVIGLHVQKAYLHSLKPTSMRALQLNFLLGVFFFALAAKTSFAQRKK